MDNAASLRAHKRNHPGDSEAALTLVYQAADLVEGIEDRADVIENIAKRAVEQLQLAERRIHQLEAEQRAAQARIKETHGKIQDAVEALRLERSRVDAAENRLYQLELRSRTAEARASAGAMIFVKRVCQKIAVMVTSVPSNVVSDSASPSIPDYHQRKLGWTVILARADAALNDAKGSGRNRLAGRKGHLALRQVAAG